MLVTMASSTLKVEEREKLYYSKYSYKAVCRVMGAYYTQHVKTIDEFKDKLETFNTQMKRYPIYIPKVMTDEEYDLVEELINYVVSFESSDKGTIRREGNNIAFYSNDLSILKKAPSSVPKKISQAVLLPAGVKYFKRDVPAPYRVHFRESRINASIKEDILSYIEKTSGVEGSSALMRWLKYGHRWAEIWSSKTHYINYTDPSQLTMMHLLFPEVIGKNYKLEKK